MRYVAYQTSKGWRVGLAAQGEELHDLCGAESEAVARVQADILNRMRGF
jgi:hypothetical protein